MYGDLRHSFETRHGRPIEGDDFLRQKGRKVINDLFQQPERMAQSLLNLLSTIYSEGVF